MADRLRETTTLLEQQGANRFRVAAYQRYCEDQARTVIRVTSSLNLGESGCASVHIVAPLANPAAISITKSIAKRIRRFIPEIGRVGTLSRRRFGRPSHGRNAVLLDL